jgi:hypothetical protein
MYRRRRRQSIRNMRRITLRSRRIRSGARMYRRRRRQSIRNMRRITLRSRRRDTRVGEGERG